MATYVDLHAIHRKLAPSKCFGNFWRCVEYKAVESALKEMGEPALASSAPSVAYRGQPAQTMAHPMVALAFTRWADPVTFYKAIIEKPL